MISGIAARLLCRRCPQVGGDRLEHNGIRARLVRRQRVCATHAAILNSHRRRVANSDIARPAAFRMAYWMRYSSHKAAVCRMRCI